MLRFLSVGVAQAREDGDKGRVGGRPIQLVDQVEAGALEAIGVSKDLDF